MADIQLFDFQGHDVRTAAHDDGSVWFVGKDVCDALGLSKYRDALSRLDDDERGSVVVDTLGGPQATTLISESGMWKLVLTSRLPSAQLFRQWLTREVLPAIRKTGSYSVQPQLSPVAQATVMIREELELDALMELPKYRTLTEAVKRIQADIGLDLSQKLLYSPVMDDIPEQEKMLEVTELAKTLNVARNRMNPLLVELELQGRVGDQWIPHAWVMEKGIASAHACTKGTKSGFNYKWNVNYVKSRVGE